MVYDLVDGEAGKLSGLFADLFWCAVVDARPAWCDDCVAGRFVMRDPVLPAERGHPEAVDEDNGWFERGSALGFIVLAVHV